MRPGSNWSTGVKEQVCAAYMVLKKARIAAHESKDGLKEHKTGARKVWATLCTFLWPAVALQGSPTLLSLNWV